MTYAQENIEYFRVRIWKSEDPLELKVGQYSWPFRFSFPSKDPSCSISYKDICYVWWSAHSFVLPQELAEMDTLHSKELRYLKKKGLSSSPVVIHVSERNSKNQKSFP